MMIMALSIWILGGVLVYLCTRVVNLEKEIKQLKDKNYTPSEEFHRILDEFSVRNHDMRMLINELVEAKKPEPRKPKEQELIAASPFLRTRRTRTDEQKRLASERAKERWAKRKAAAKSEVSAQPPIESRKISTL